MAKASLRVLGTREAWWKAPWHPDTHVSPRLPPTVRDWGPPSLSRLAPLGTGGGGSTRTPLGPTLCHCRGLCGERGPQSLR